MRWLFAVVCCPTELPAIRQLLQGVPASVLVDPSKPQARLPFTISWQ
jgi:hypothetical protein